MSYNWFINGTTTLRKRFFNRKEFNEMKIALASSDVSNIVANINQSISELSLNNSNLLSQIEDINNQSSLLKSIHQIDYYSDKYDLGIAINKGGAILLPTHLDNKDYINYGWKWTEIIFPTSNELIIGKIFLLTICRPNNSPLGDAWDLWNKGQYWIHQPDNQYYKIVGNNILSSEIETKLKTTLPPFKKTRVFVFQWLGYGIGWTCLKCEDY